VIKFVFVEQNDVSVYKLLKHGGLKRQYFGTDGRESLNSHAPKLSGSENKSKTAICSPKD